MKILNFLTGNSNSLTNIVKSNNDKQFSLAWYNYIPALLSNGFSILFSSSIIFELRNFLSGWVLIILTVFVLLFLILNEYTKVQELRKLVKGSKNALLPFIITFLISITLASIGIYFITNKSMEIKDNSNIEKNINITNTNLKYESQILDVNKTNIFENSKEFDVLNKDLYYWQHISASSLEERNNIRNKIAEIQGKINDSRQVYKENVQKLISNINSLKQQEISVINAKYNKVNNNQQRNNFISYIFLSLIIITEFATIILNKNIAEKQIKIAEFTDGEMAKTYIVVRNTLTTLYMTKDLNGETNIEKMKYSSANKDNFLNWEVIMRYYNLFISFGILDEGYVAEISNGDKVKKVLTNKIIMPENQAQILIDNYFNKALKMGL